MIVPLFVGREKSIKALEEVMRSDTFILLATQKNASDDDPATDAIFEVGTLASVLQLLKLPDGTVKVLVEGAAARARSSSTPTAATITKPSAVVLDDVVGEKVEAEALARSVVTEFENYVKLNKKVSPEVVGVVQQIEDYAKLADTVASHLAVKIPDKQAILETPSVTERLEKVLGLMESEISVLQVEKRIRTRVKRQMEKTQREYYLNEQMKAIQKELGDEEGKDELAETRRQDQEDQALEGSPREGARTSSRSCGRCRRCRPKRRSCATISIGCCRFRGTRSPRSRRTSRLAQDILDADHFGLEKVKERIVEYLAVQQRANKLTGPILCLVGPPGVGKTSLGKSIAKATGREFVRVSLGGVRDEAEIRGHRRTYIGSMPGKIIQSMRKAKTSNPLFLLDEVDKMGADFRGDPSSALLEVLDPEQNHTFNDHYLEVDYDLSNVMFITTANTLNIPPPLMDRMEIIRIAGYTEDEKVEIARKHLIPNAIAKHGLESEGMVDRRRGAAAPDPPLHARSGRAQSRARAFDPDPQGGEGADARRRSRSRSTAANLGDYLGVPKYRYGEVEAEDLVGVVTGLAWTDVGGELLTIEGVMMPGKGRMTVTGNLRDVMKESISAAASYVRSRAIAFGIEPPLFDKRDIHVHVPEGATPKDGPSAGVAMVTAIVSVMTGIPVRSDVAMTGEITLRGRVLPIGGLKEKLLAARRGGIKTVLIPEENAKDLAEISDSIKKRPRDHPGLAHGRGAGARAGAQARADHLGRGAAKPAPSRGRAGGRGRRLGPDRALTRYAFHRMQTAAFGPPFLFA